MTAIATKRIFKDYKEYHDSNLSQDGIYCIMDEDNMYQMRAMIMGPEDTPYEGGIYYFLIQFPKNYPFSPPKVSIETRDNRVRINPNYYKCGKVCLSILNTWAGEQWTSVCSLLSVLNTLRSRFNETPIINEPGYEKSGKSVKSKDYNKVLAWYNIELAVYNSLHNPPPTFDCFYTEARLEFCKNYEYYIRYLTSLYKDDNTVFTSRIYNCKALIKPFVYASLLCDIYEQVYPNFKSLLEPERNNEEETVVTETSSTNEEIKQSEPEPETKTETETETETKTSEGKKKKGIRRVPKEKATDLNVGTKRKSETNGNMYIVDVRKDGRQYWKKIEVNL